MDTRSDPEETLAALDFEEDEPPSRRATVPPRRPTGAYENRDFTPPAPVAASGLLSLANARIPSELPPRDTEANTNERRTQRPPSFERRTDPSPSTSNPRVDVRRVPARSTPVGLGPPPRELFEAAERVSGRYGGSASTDSLVRAGYDDVPPTPKQEMKDRIALGDYTGALDIAEGLLAESPADAEVRATIETCRGVLKNMYITRIGQLDRVPTVIVSRDELRWLSIDHRAGFVLSLVDGISTVEMLLDVSGMPELDTLRILSELGQQRILAFR